MNFLLLYLISLLTRLPFLFSGFPTITHDEADIFVNSYLISKTGSDIFGKNFFMTSGALSANSPLAFYYLAIFFLFLPKTIYVARFAFLIINSLIPVIIYFIVSRLTKNKLVSLLSYFSLNFSPWLTYISGQSGFNAPISLVFYLTAILCLLYIKKNTVRYLLFFLCLFLSFNSYLGFASVFPVFVFIALIIDHIYNFDHYKHNTVKTIKKIILLLSISLFTYVLFIMFILKLPGNDIFKSTQAKILTINKDLYLNKLWYENYVKSGNVIADKILNNKFTVIINLAFERYISAFNPSILFLKGDPHAIYGTNRFGLFYLFEIIFLFTGLIKFFEIIKNKNSSLYSILLAIIIASPISIILQPEITLAFRSIMLVFPISILIGIGIYYFVNKYKFNYYFVLILYLCSYLFFLMVFNFKTKIISSEQWHISEKQLFEKIEINDKNSKTVVINPDQNASFLLYSFYKINDAELIKEKWQKKDYSFNNISFTNSCPLKLTSNTIYLVKRDTCKNERYSFSPYLYASDKSGIMYYKIESIK